MLHHNVACQFGIKSLAPSYANMPLSNVTSSRVRQAITAVATKTIRTKA